MSIKKRSFGEQHLADITLVIGKLAAAMADVDVLANDETMSDADRKALGADAFAFLKLVENAMTRIAMRGVQQVLPVVTKNSPDDKLLNWLEMMAERRGGILLHDGSEGGRLGIGLRPGRSRRTLRQAIRAAMKGTCRVCGCTQAQACPGGCYWVEPDLCSTCARVIDRAE